MLSIAARIVTVVALCFAIGLHWIVLQSVAWTTMAARNVTQTSFCEAVKRTFDGAHPCSLCHIVNKGKASEQNRDLQSPTPKIDFIAVARIIRILPQMIPFEYVLLNCSAFARWHSPPVPPPRNAVV